LGLGFVWLELDVAERAGGVKGARALRRADLDHLKIETRRVRLVRARVRAKVRVRVRLRVRLRLRLRLRAGLLLVLGLG